MIPSPDSPDAPKYWMQETSGVLKPVIEKLLTAENLTPREIAIVRAYFRQWVMAPAWDLNPHASKRSRDDLERLRTSVETIRTFRAIARWLADAVSQGMDPL